MEEEKTAFFAAAPPDRTQKHAAKQEAVYAGKRQILSKAAFLGWAIFFAAAPHRETRKHAAEQEALYAGKRQILNKAAFLGWCHFLCSRAA